MAGHSHFHNIKHKKGRADVARGKIFSKLSKMITVCAKDRGGDINTNSQLRLAVEKAKDANMPKINVENAIKKGTGEIKANNIESLSYEVIGPLGSGFIIEIITDNKNRTTSEIKNIVNKIGLNFANTGSVKWMFEYSGIIEIEDILDGKKKEAELNLIEADADDLFWYKNEEERNNIIVYVKIENLEEIKKKIEIYGFKIKDSKLGWKAKEVIKIIEEKEREKIIKFLEELNDNDDVSEIYFNFV